MVAGNYRYVIVGAGSAGCVLANRLSADPACQVALLEAGGPDRAREIRIPVALTKLFQSAYDWNYRTAKQPQLSDRDPRACTYTYARSSATQPDHRYAATVTAVISSTNRAAQTMFMRAYALCS